MALTPSRTGRLLPLVLLSVLLAACATATASGLRPAAEQWVVLGEGDASKDVAALVDGQSARGPEAPRITDLSERGAGIEAVIQQLAALPERQPDRFILRLGEADIAAASPLSAERYGQLVAALLVTLRHRAPVTVIPIAEGIPPSSVEETLTVARRLRRTAAYNEAIRSAARLYGVTVAGNGGEDSEAGSLWPSGTTLDRLRARADRGAAAGLRPELIAKVGDSITSSPAFLHNVMEAGLRSGGQVALLETFRAVTAGPVSPLTRQSLAARDRWSAADAIEGGEDSPLAREIDALRPGVAVVMFGTNDLTHLPLASFEEDLDRLLAELDRRDVVALLSTIPERRDSAAFAARVPSFNQAIRALSLAHGVPLIDYHTMMASLPNAGLAPDGIHPSVCPEGAGELDAGCLHYGYNLRNLLTLQALDRLYAALAAPSLGLGEDLIGGR